MSSRSTAGSMRERPDRRVMNGTAGPPSSGDADGTVKGPPAERRPMAAPDGRSHRLFAALYDPVTALAERTLFREHREYLVADLSGTVLDLGAGTGPMFPYFADAAAEATDLSVHAVDPDPHMRRRAERRAAGLRLSVDIVEADAGALPYGDDAFDAVVASLVLCTVPDVDAALSEVARVLAPGGELRFLEHVHGGGWYGRLQSSVTPAWRVLAAGCHLDRATDVRLAAHPLFSVADRERFSHPVPPVTPFVRGRLVRTDGG